MDLDRLARTAARAAGAPTGLVVLTDPTGRVASGVSGLDAMGRGLRRAVGVPIRGRDGAVVGRIAVLGRASGGWTADDMAALDDLAALVGASIPGEPPHAVPGGDAASDLLASLRRELARRGTTPALVVVHADDLDALMVTRGGAAGEALVDALVARLRAALRASDEVVRWHGGRVAALAVDIPDAAAAERVCDKLRAAARLPAGMGTGAAPISISIGVALGGPTVASPGALVEEAERALTEARSGGGGRAGGAWTLDRSGSGLGLDPDAEAEAMALVERAGGGDAARVARAVEATRLTGLVAARAGLDPGQVARARLGALAADVGPGTLSSRLGWAGHDEIDRRTRAERARADARVLGRSPALRAVAPIALHRHERWDGTGVPDGLAGTRIPPESRVVACVLAFLDVRDASASGPAALERLQVLAAGAFDPTVLRAITGVVVASAPRPRGTDVR